MIFKTLKKLWECVKTCKCCIKPASKFSKWEMEDKNQTVNSHCHNNIKICLKNNSAGAQFSECLKLAKYYCGHGRFQVFIKMRNGKVESVFIMWLVQK